MARGGALLALLGLACAAHGGRILRRFRTRRAEKSVYKYDREEPGSMFSATARRSWAVKLAPGRSGDPARLCKGSGCECTAMPDVGVLLATCTEADLEGLLDARSELELAEEDGELAIDLPVGEDAVDNSSELQGARSAALTWNLRRIGLTSASATGRGVRIWVVDSGIRPSHEDLRGRVELVAYADERFGFGLCESQTDSRCADDIGHGTHVASTAAGSKFGIAKEAKVLSLKMLNNGMGNTIHIIQGLDYIARSRAPGDVVNLSLGSKGRTPIVTDVLKKLTEYGVHVIVAAGNSDEDACTGQFSRNRPIFVVGASTERDSRASFSNWGDCLDLYAPGAQVAAAGYQSDDSYVLMSGTSMAAPHVAGVAALYLESRRSATPEALYHHLKASALWGQLENLRAGDPDRLLFIGPTDPSQSAKLNRTEGEFSDWGDSCGALPWPTALAPALLLGALGWRL